MARAVVSLLALLIFVYHSPATRGFLHRGASLGGPGGARFDDITQLDLQHGDVMFRISNLLLWGLDREALPAFEASYLALDHRLSGVQWPGKRNTGRYPDQTPRYYITIESGDIIERMFGYFYSDPNSYNGLFLLNGIGFDIRKKDGTFFTYRVGKTEGHLQSILGPIVGFWGGLGGAFDQLGVYVDPMWWPDRPTRMLKTDLHGRVRSYPDWTYFDDVDAMAYPFVVRIVGLEISYNNSGIFGLAVTYLTHNSSVMQLDHGSSPAGTTVVRINLSADLYIEELQVEWPSSEPLLADAGSGMDCLRHMQIKVMSETGHELVYKFGNSSARTFVTSDRVVAFHGVSSDLCIKRLGGFVLLPQEEFPRACKLPPAPTNGRIVGSPDEIGEGTAIVFECDSGYSTPDGPKPHIVCQHDGFWDRPIPTCTVGGDQTGQSQQSPPASTSTTNPGFFNALSIVLLVAVCLLLVAVVALSVFAVILCVRIGRKKNDGFAAHYLTESFDDSATIGADGKRHATVSNPLYEYNPQSADTFSK